MPSVVFPFDIKLNSNFSLTYCRSGEKVDAKYGILIRSTGRSSQVDKAKGVLILYAVRMRRVTNVNPPILLTTTFQPEYAWICIVMLATLHQRAIKGSEDA